MTATTALSNYLKLLAKAESPEEVPSFTFSSRDEIEQYFSGDKVACLLCGKSFAVLGSHLFHCHQTNAREYKYRFGIPSRHGLAGVAYRQYSADRIQDMFEQGQIPKEPTAETIERLKSYNRPGKRFAAVDYEEFGKRVLRTHGKETAWQPDHYETFLKRVQAGRTPDEVAADEDMPSRSALKKYMAKNPSYRERFNTMWEQVPFALQIKGRKTGKRYREEIWSLRSAGKSWDEIARSMGVRKNVLQQMWYSMRSESAERIAD